jgi:hypothetical protein
MLYITFPEKYIINLYQAQLNLKYFQHSTYIRGQTFQGKLSFAKATKEAVFKPTQSRRLEFY